MTPAGGEAVEGNPGVTEPHHSVYVIELDEAVREKRRFAAANVGCDPEKECFYVGCTGLTPEERFARHRRGKQHSHYVKEFGIRLRPDLYEHLNPMTYEDAGDMEVELAERLRMQGYAVWQH